MHDAPINRNADSLLGNPAYGGVGSPFDLLIEPLQTIGCPDPPAINYRHNLFFCASLSEITYVNIFNFLKIKKP